MGCVLFAHTLRDCVANFECERCPSDLYRSRPTGQRSGRDSDRDVHDRYNQEWHIEYYRALYSRFCRISSKWVDSVVSHTTVHSNGFIRPDQSRIELDGYAERNRVFACLWLHESGN
jgi:hypothetical protein